MRVSNDPFKRPPCGAPDEDFSADLPPLAGGVELIECDSEPVPEVEISEDPNRWTLPSIREGAAVALFVCLAAPALMSCLSLAALGALASLKRTNDE